MAILVANVRWTQEGSYLLQTVQERKNFHIYLIGFSKFSEIRIQNLCRNQDHAKQWHYSSFELLHQWDFTNLSAALPLKELTQAIWVCRTSGHYLSFPENGYIFLEHKGDLEEKQTVLSSTSKGFLHMHISHWIKIALNPGLSKLLILEKPVSSGQRRQKWHTTKRPLLSVSATWNTILVSSSVSQRELTNTDCKEQSKHEQGVGCLLLLSAFWDLAKFLFKPNWKLWRNIHKEKTKIYSVSLISTQNL